MMSTTSMSPPEQSLTKKRLHFASHAPDAVAFSRKDDAIGYAIEQWLLHSYPPTSGESTALIYRKLLSSLRAYLGERELDLDSPSSQLAREIQSWASLRSPTSKRAGHVAPATYNQRIAAISSFYTWTSERGLYSWPNPAKELDRFAIQKYAGAQALDVQRVREQLQTIDRSTAQGQRDFVLLQIALNTGRSARELAGLTWGNLTLHDEHVTLAFEKGRGGKVMYDTLAQQLSHMLLAYLRALYGENLATLSPQAPIWLSFSNRTYRQAIGPQTIADICETYLGVSKIHTLRHTFALAMDQLGAPVSTIQARLGHEHPATTDIYLASLKRAHNPYAPALADAFGLGTHERLA